MTTAITTKINGVEVSRLTDTVQAVSSNPSLAAFQFRLQNRWIDCGQNQSEVQPFFGCGQEIAHREPMTLVADEPGILLGQDKGANPAEYLLHALAACVTTSMIYHAAARGIVIDAVESSIEGDADVRGFLDLDPNVRKGFQKIRMNIRIKSNVPDDQLRELGLLGPMYSPVFDTITNGVSVAVQSERMA